MDGEMGGGYDSKIRNSDRRKTVEALLHYLCADHFHSPAGRILYDLRIIENAAAAAVHIGNQLPGGSAIMTRHSQRSVLYQRHVLVSPHADAAGEDIDLGESCLSDGTGRVIAAGAVLINDYERNIAEAVYGAEIAFTYKLQGKIDCVRKTGYISWDIGNIDVWLHVHNLFYD